MIRLNFVIIALLIFGSCTQLNQEEAQFSNDSIINIGHISRPLSKKDSIISNLRYFNKIDDSFDVLIFSSDEINDCLSTLDHSKSNHDSHFFEDLIKLKDAQNLKIEIQKISIESIGDSLKNQIGRAIGANLIITENVVDIPCKTLDSITLNYIICSDYSSTLRSRHTSKSYDDPFGDSPFNKTFANLPRNQFYELFLKRNYLEQVSLIRRIIFENAAFVLYKNNDFSYST